MIPTPAFVVDEPLLALFAERFESALERHWPNSILSYSFKTNALPWLISYLRERGFWAEVVSDHEYELALALGYPAERIVYNGPVKGRERLRAALAAGSIVNLDAKREVEWAAELGRELPDAQLAVGLRVNWDLEARVPGESTTGAAGSRFGFNVDNGELDEAIARLRAGECASRGCTCTATRAVRRLTCTVHPPPSPPSSSPSAGSSSTGSTSAVASSAASTAARPSMTTSAPFSSASRAPLTLRARG